MVSEIVSEYLGIALINRVLDFFRITSYAFQRRKIQTRSSQTVIQLLVEAPKAQGLESQDYVCDGTEELFPSFTLIHEYTLLLGVVSTGREHTEGS